MGRPIKESYFLTNAAGAGEVMTQYQGVTASVNAGGTHYSTGVTAVVSAPNDAAGLNATVSLTVTTATGAIASISVTNQGSGYNAAPTVTIVAPATQTATVTTNTTNTLTLNGVNGIYVGMKVVGTGINTGTTYVLAVNPSTKVVGLSLANANSNLVGNVITFSDTGSGATFTTGLTSVDLVAGTIATTAYIPVADGGTSAVTSTIVKQKGSHRYLIENAQGTGICNLVTTSTSLTAGQMSVIATDANGSTYFVGKLTMNYAVLYQYAKSGSFVIDNGARAQWTTGSASGSVVSIATNAT